jgi:hypothetical protein
MKCPARLSSVGRAGSLQDPGRVFEPRSLDQNKSRCSSARRALGSGPRGRWVGASYRDQSFLWWLWPSGEAPECESGPGGVSTHQLPQKRLTAGIAQQVEQLFRKEQVAGSKPCYRHQIRALVAQLEERWPVTPEAAGSGPVGSAKTIRQ